MKQIKRIGVFSCGKIVAVIYAVLGLVAGAIFTLLTLAGASMMAEQDMGSVGALVGAWAIVAMPILMLIYGFIAGVIVAWVYNVVASWIGGLELEIV